MPGMERVLLERRMEVLSIYSFTRVVDQASHLFVTVPGHARQGAITPLPTL